MRGSKRIFWSYAALVVAVALVLVLAMQNRRLRTDNVALAERATEPYPGMWVPEITTRTLDGHPIKLGAPQATAEILYFFTPQCPYCRRSAPQIRLLAARLKSEQPQIALIGLADADAADVRAHASEQRFDFPIVAKPDHRVIGLFKANAVPTIVVVRRGGRVGYAHVGAIDTKEGVDAILDAVRKPLDGRASPQPTETAEAASGNRRDST